MPSIIRVLDEQTINKIAAGEVIENPSSVVKELVENAIDAGSTDICIEIKGGGRQLIRITDNGCGMNADDALLCLERHATSKIRDMQDIYAISTMGFRGEAVPSIAAISKFTLITSESDSTTGTMVIVEGGKILQCCPAVRSRGTTIEVKSLFFNVPVRKKFQKSPAYDANEILKMVSNIALGHPQIKLQLINDQSTVLATSPSSDCFMDTLKTRIKDIIGIDFIESSCPLESTQEGYSLKGFIGLPSNTRHNRTGQYLFINQRAIVSPLVSFAMRDGYGTMLSPGRHPVYVLHLTMPGELVDVNVHPQKREVRLRQEKILRDMIVQSVEKALQHFSGFNMPEEFCAPVVEPSSHSSQVRYVTPHAFRPSFIEIPRMDSTFEMPPMPQLRQSDKATSPAPSLELAPSPAPPSARVLTTIKHYIIVDRAAGHDGLCLVDQKAAHARIIFEKLQKQISGHIEVQALLFPYTFTVTPSENALILEHLESLNELGIGMHQTGPNAFLVDEVPQIFGKADVHALITDLIHSLRESQSTESFKQEQAKRLATAAGRAAISQGRHLHIDEAQSLVNQLMQCKIPYQCPLGKPTMINITYEDLEKRFQPMY